MLKAVNRTLTGLCSVWQIYELDPRTGNALYNYSIPGVDRTQDVRVFPPAVSGPFLLIQPCLVPYNA